MEKLEKYLKKDAHLMEKQQKSVQFPQDIREAIEQSARANERSFSAEVVYAMRQYLKLQQNQRDQENWGASVSAPAHSSQRIA